MFSGNWRTPSEARFTTLFLDANKPLVFVVNKGRRRCQTRSRPVSILNHPWYSWIENSVGRRIIHGGAQKIAAPHIRGGVNKPLARACTDPIRPLAV
jgi:hypothetical protein